MRTPAAVAALVAVALVAITLPAPLSAQEASPEAFIIRFEADDDTLSGFNPIRAFIGQTECGSVDLSTGDRTIVVGGPGTPPECNRPWRVIDLVPDGLSDPLFIQPIFQRGGSVTISNFAPYPAVDGPDLPPFWVEMRPDGEQVREADLAALGSLTAYVGGVACGSASLTDLPEPLATIPVGDEGTPDVCRELGAEIVLVAADGRRLLVRPSITAAPYYNLTNLATEPAPSGPPGPAPAAVGYGPTARTPDAGWVPLAALLAMLGCIGLGRRATRSRPR